MHAVVDGEVDRRIRLLRQRVQERARGSADVDLGERRVAQADRGAAERVLSRRVRRTQEAEVRERVDEPRDGGLRESRPCRDFLIRQPPVARTEATQDVETASQRIDELAVRHGCDVAFERVTSDPRHET